MNKEELLKEKLRIEQSLKDLEKGSKIIVNGWDLTNYECWYDEDYCRKAVKQNSSALQYVKVQIEEICKLAVEANSDVLPFVDKRVFQK